MLRLSVGPSISLRTNGGFAVCWWGYTKAGGRDSGFRLGGRNDGLGVLGDGKGRRRNDGLGVRGDGKGRRRNDGWGVGCGVLAGGPRCWWAGALDSGSGAGMTGGGRGVLAGGAAMLGMGVLDSGSGAGMTGWGCGGMARGGAGMTGWGRERVIGR